MCAGASMGKGAALGQEGGGRGMGMVDLPLKEVVAGLAYASLKCL